MTGDDGFTLDNLKIDGKTFHPAAGGPASKKKTRKPFRAQWVRLPMEWVETLDRATSKHTIKLAHRVLIEAFRQKHIGGEIALSAAVTRMPHSTRARAIRELVELGLIEVEQTGRRAVRIRRIII